MNYKHILLIVLAVILQRSTYASEIVVTEGQDLQQIIDDANGGDIIVINGGVYDPISISNRRFSIEAPLVIKGGDIIPVIKSDEITAGRAIYLNDVSYIVFDSLKVVGGIWGIQGYDVDNVIIKDIEITGQGQEGIILRNGSEYVDIINCQIHDIGLHNPQWGEGIYLGGDEGGNEYLWVENCTIYECGRGEAINIKADECKYVTITGNNIHDIHPGTSTQWNGGAIGVDGNNSTEDKRIWIQHNLIDSVYGGATSNTGIETSQAGARVVYNTIKNCDDRGIWFNDYQSYAPCWNYGNSFSGNGEDIRKNNSAVVYNEDPGLSPYSAQTWYSEGKFPLSITTSKLPYAICTLPYNAEIDAYGGSGNYYWNIEGDLPSGMETNEEVDKLFLSGEPLDKGIFNFTAIVEDDITASNKQLQLLVADIDTCNLANHLTFTKVIGDLETTHPVKGLWDGDWLTIQEGWPGGSTIDSFIVEFDFKKLIPLSEIRIFGDSDGTWYSSRFSVQYRSDTTEQWSPIISDENIFDSKWFAFDVDIEAKYIQLSVTGNTELHRTQVREFEVYKKIRHRSLELTPEPIDGGFLTGNGDHLKDSLVTISATPATGFVFTGWYTLEGELVSEESDYSIILLKDTSLEARFGEISSAVEDKYLVRIVEMYPNPATTHLHYKCDITPNSILLKNALGSTIKKLRPVDNNSGLIDISGLVNGIYFVEFVFNEESLLKKLLIQ